MSTGESVDQPADQEDVEVTEGDRIARQLARVVNAINGLALAVANVQHAIRDHARSSQSQTGATPPGYPPR